MQQINLYQPVLKRKSKPLSFGSMVLFTTLFVLLCGGYIGYSKWQYQERETKLQALEQRVEQMRAENEKLEKAFPVKQKSKLLEKRLEQIRVTQQAKQHALALLNSGYFGNTEGFSAYMEGMARQRIDKLWLSNIAIKRGGEQMQIKGSTYSADLLPRYLQQLAVEKVFKGREFAIFSMTRSTQKSREVEFSLQSAAEQEAKP
ncbi:hypothetical protein BOW53_10745 [Solemya pervernicosa gill symbiont]|uniref:Fimbrial assembly protein n=2 Tax=Gammaproteobacteria incertae sedis TaxID=118884 RepID=A0A1T2L3F5_9GAMM|nr:PilN domain-containing protein [Candidatus Reidiella endopervernicosa]OOZ39614.1 hypothetical protein BOW53_10745 [Solemya pervernicosa gill symbiont]QKQ25457.1 PilN domain-containing protein [Candidatus Reidiella endopervernicosa]